MKSGRRFGHLEEFIQESVRHFHGSLLALVRWSRSGGATDYLLFRDPSCFEEFCRKAPRSTNIIVFLETPQPLRVESEPDCIGKLKGLIDEGQEWLVVEVVKSGDEWSHHTAPYNFVGQYRYELDEERDNLMTKDLFFFSVAPSWEVTPYFEIVIKNVIGIY